MITWKLPFSTFIAHERVYVIDAEYKRLTEITPGQFQGYVPSLADLKSLGGEIAWSLNQTHSPGEWKS